MSLLCYKREVPEFEEDYDEEDGVYEEDIFDEGELNMFMLSYCNVQSVFLC
jgi:hypothetical protein